MERYRLFEPQLSHGFLPFPHFLLVAQKPLAQVLEDGPVSLSQFGLRQAPDVRQILPAPDLAQDAVCEFLMMSFNEIDQPRGKHPHTSEFTLARSPANGQPKRDEMFRWRSAAGGPDRRPSQDAADRLALSFFLDSVARRNRAAGRHTGHQSQPIQNTGSP